MANRTCPVCESKIKAGAHGNRVYCSRSCTQKATYRRRVPERHIVGGGSCAHCGGWIPQRPGPVEPLYCSKSCRSAAHYGRIRKSLNAAKRKKAAEYRAKIVKTCPHCFGEFSPANSVRQKFCSRECGQSYRRDRTAKICSEAACDRPVRAKGVCNMHYKRILRAEGRMNDKNWTPAKAAAWYRRKGMLEADAEVFDYREIFDRDGWECGICHSPVDPALSHPDPMSASLDHIVPVSLGGAHRRDNVQCSHLRCNIRKSNKIPERQRDAAA